VSSIEVRPFRRGDRQQLTALVNAHVAAVLPGVSLSVTSVMSHLERDAGEYIVDPWVEQRVTLVVEQRQRIVAAAHLLRYGSDERVGETYRNAGEIRWLLYWPPVPAWPDSGEAGEMLAMACLKQLDGWGVTRAYADGTLPAPGVYGVPEQWPHVRAIYEKAGFHHAGKTEIVFVARVDDLPRLSAPHVRLRTQRTLGVNGTRIWAVIDDEAVGHIEVDTNLGEANRAAGISLWADVGNLHVRESHRRHGIASWLVGQAAEWLSLGGVECLLDYADVDESDCIAFLHRAGFRELTRTIRGLVIEPRPRDTGT
jgi:GNAT superfamily N-acetyltransferase